MAAAVTWRHCFKSVSVCSANCRPVRNGSQGLGGRDYKLFIVWGINNQGMCRVLNLHPPPGEGWQWNKQSVIIIWTMWWLFAGERVFSPWFACLSQFFGSHITDRDVTDELKRATITFFCKSKRKENMYATLFFSTAWYSWIEMAVVLKESAAFSAHFWPPKIRAVLSSIMLANFC